MSPGTKVAELTVRDACAEVTFIFSIPFSLFSFYYCRLTAIGSSLSTSTKTGRGASLQV